MKKQLIFTKLFDTGGSNASMRALVKVFGAENVLLIVEDINSTSFANDIDSTGKLQTKVVKNLHGYAHLEYRLISNIKESLKIFWSLIRIMLLCLRFKSSTITVSAVEPEKFLYFFWLPFIKVNYLLHTVPGKKYTAFTSFTCNSRLGKRKKLVVVSDFMKNTIVKEWDIRKSGEFIKVIYNCADQALTTEPNPGTIRKIVTIGRLDDNKNPDTWLKVARTITASYQDVSFIWIGNGENLEGYQHLASKLKNIEFIGYHAKTENWLKQAFIYYQPSKMESHGIAVVEAMAWGLPCIVSDRGGLPESVSTGYNGLLIEPLNFEDHIKAIELLLNNKETTAEMGQNSKKRYNERYAFEIFKEKIQRLYHINI